MLVYLHKSGQGTVIDFRESAPSKAHKDLFNGDASKGIRGLFFFLLHSEMQRKIKKTPCESHSPNV